MGRGPDGGQRHRQLRPPLRRISRQRLRCRRPSAVLVCSAPLVPGLPWQRHRPRSPCRGCAVPRRPHRPHRGFASRACTIASPQHSAIAAAGTRGCGSGAVQAGTAQSGGCRDRLSPRLSPPSRPRGLWLCGCSGAPRRRTGVRADPSPAHPSFPAQVRPPGADPAGGAGLPGGRGLLPGVARRHRAAAGTALARQRLRRPRAGRPPANPGQGWAGHRVGAGTRCGTAGPGGGGGAGAHGERGIGGGRCHGRLSPRRCARRSAGGWQSWTVPWSAGSGSWRW